MSSNHNTTTAATTTPTTTTTTTSSNSKEVAHYVVTAHPPGAVHMTAKCNFLSETSLDVLVAKSRRLEVRQLRSGGETSAGGGMGESSVGGDGTTASAIIAAAAAAGGSGGGVQTPFPVVLSVPMNGRLTALCPFQTKHCQTSYVFFTTDQFRYAVVSYDPKAITKRSPYPIRTHASGSLLAAGGGSAGSSFLDNDLDPNNANLSGSGGGDGAWMAHGNQMLGRPAESGHLVAMDPYSRCIALHIYDGLITIIPINKNFQPMLSRLKSGSGGNYADEDDDEYNASMNRPREHSLLGPVFHCRIEERTVLAISFLYTGDDVGPGSSMPQLCVLHQDSRGCQHMISHVVNIPKQQLHLFGSHSAPSSTQWLKKSSVDGGSALLIPVPTRWSMPTTGPPVAAAAAAAAATTASDMDEQQQQPSQLGGVVILGQRQFTYCSPTVTKILPVPQALFLSYETLPADPFTGMPRFLIGDEFGNIHMLTLLKLKDVVFSLQLETLGSCALSSSLTYLGEGLVYVGSSLGDSQLVQIHDEPIAEKQDDEMDLADTTYLSVVEEYTHLGPILDFDLVPTTPGASTAASATAGGAAGTAGGASNQNNNIGNNSNANQYVQCQVVTASGSSKSGSLRLIRNGIGMNEYASVEIPGIQNMWSVRRQWDDQHHAYLIQSFVGETRVLGVVAAVPSADAGNAADMDDAMMTSTMMQDNDDDPEAKTPMNADDSERLDDGGGGEGDDDDEVGGTLEEVMLPGLESSACSLYVGNVAAANSDIGGDRLLQITETEIRLFSPTTGQVFDSWNEQGLLTVATANEAGQVAVAMRGGTVAYFRIEGDKIKQISQKQMDREVSCLDLHPFALSSSSSKGSSAMEIDNADGPGASKMPRKSDIMAVGLWDDFTVRLLSLSDSSPMEEALCIHLSTDEDEDAEEAAGAESQRRTRNNMMARSLSLLTLDYSSSSGGSGGAGGGHASAPAGIDMLFIGLGDGTLISFAVVKNQSEKISVRSRKEVCLGTQRIDLIPLATERGGTCVLATGDRPTVIYLAGVAGTASNHFNPKLCYSTVNLSASDDEEGDDVSRPPSQQAIAVNVAAPFFSPLLFDVASLGTQHYSLCVADDSNLRLGVIDDIQKLHVTTCRLGMAPRRIVHCADGRLFAVGCIESGIKFFGLGDDENNMGNCLRFMDDTTFDDIERVDLEPYETILSMCYATLKVTSSTDSEGPGGDDGGLSNYKPFLLVGTGYALPDEDEPTRGRILVYSFQADDAAATNSSRVVRQVTEFSAQGGVYSICQFYEGRVLCSINSKTMLCQLVDDTGFRRLQFVGIGHHGHILSLSVRSRAKRMLTDSLGRAGPGGNNLLDGQQQRSGSNKEDKPKEMLAIVGDLMRSVSLVQYYPQHDTLEEIARDFNSNWTTAIEMLTNDVYLASENWNNLYCLRRNNSSSEEVRCRLDTIGEFHLGEMCNKFMRGSLVMPVSNASDNKRRARRLASSPTKKSTGAASTSSSSPSRGALGATRRPVVTTGSQTLFGTVEGTLGVILGLDGRTAAFFATLERAMASTIRPIGNLSHQYYRASHGDSRIHPAYGFIDGDLVETFLDLDRGTMEAVVDAMNIDGGWEVDDAILRKNGEKKDAGASAGSGTDDRAGTAEADADRSDLTVDDVLAMVEEMAMLH